MLRERVDALRSSFLDEIKGVSESKDLEQLRTKYFGKKGFLQELMTSLRDAPPAERPALGKIINELKEELSRHTDEMHAKLVGSELAKRLDVEWLDATLPGRRKKTGSLHPITQTLNRVTDILISMGFSVRLGPDVDTDYYNFGGLNFAPDHPARDMQDTFYLSTDLLLRTHTSNVQVHTMEECKPPIRIIAPGRCFRNEDVSARSHVFFHQVEGVYIDKDVTFADLLSTLDEFLIKLLGPSTKTRFRPSYFPFVEPGLEVDVLCISCEGKGCRTCKHTGWLEILGAGLVHPNVLKSGNIDPEIYSGFAWGMGIERLTMLLHNIPDIRLFTENDTRFLEQFA